MEIPVYVVDAFTNRPFGGNPAAVCPLDRWPATELLQQIAAEHNLSETAFFVPIEGGFELRWFTPVIEMDLCGHATLASAFVLFNELKYSGNEIAFETRSGTLRVVRDGDLLALDFPARSPKREEMSEALAAALGQRPLEYWSSRDALAVYASEEEVRSLDPDMGATAKLDHFAVIVTAPGTDVDFVSRFFAPAQGIPEDPVTGSAHCTLIPYWAEKLGKTKLRARQISARGGDLYCELDGDRVRMAGHAHLFSKGTIYLSESAEEDAGQTVATAESA